MQAVHCLGQAARQIRDRCCGSCHACADVRRRVLPWRGAGLLPLLLCLDGRHRVAARDGAAHPEVPGAVRNPTGALAPQNLLAGELSF